MRIHVFPHFAGADQGEGGVRRVVEELDRSFPRVHIETRYKGEPIQPGDAALLACHITAPDAYLNLYPEKPIVAHIHGLYWSDYEWANWAYKANDEVLRLIRVADVITAPTEWVARIIERHTSRDVRVVPHGVSCRDWKPVAQHSGYVLWNKTRPDPVCDPEPLNALARAMPQQQFVSTFADEAANVLITGRQPYDQAKDIIRNAGVYLVTTRETFGIGTLEAMAAGVPVVGYRYGGQAEFIEHGVDGWLVEPGDIDGLAFGVEWALDNREEISVAARNKALQYPWARAAEAYAKIYFEVVERREHYQQSPRVSIVVPAYNLAGYLRDTLDSVKAQTDDDWECIVVDDASPDECGAIAEEYAQQDPRFRVIHNEKNLYLAEARNVAIDAARGEYILPVDADDRLGPQAVSLLKEALDADRDLQVAYGGVFFVAEDGKRPIDYGVSTPGHSNWPVPWDPQKQVQGWNCAPYASMFRREAWRQVGGYRSRLKMAEDADFWTRLASFGFPARQVTKNDTLIYRVRDNSMSAEAQAQRMDYLRWYPWAKIGELAPAGLLGARSVALLMPRVSVVIPVGPGHEHIAQTAVDSVMAQSFQNWECIVVNDTGRELKRMPTWVRVIDCDARDVSVARNMGIAAAQGILYLPLDADDYLQPDALQWLVSAWAQIGDQRAVVYPDFFEDPDEEGKFKIWHLQDWDCQRLTEKGVLHSITALTPVSVWRAVGGYSEGAGWEDWDFQLKCAAAGICSHHLRAPLFTYRKWTGRRRDYSPAEFEERKAWMLERWGEYFRKEKDFMACGCNSSNVTPAPVSLMGAQLPPGEDAVQVEYVGTKSGSTYYRGSTGTIYDFASGEPPKWVDARDIAIFKNRSDFRLVADAPASASEPALLTHA